MGLLGNGERRGWEGTEVSGSRIWLLSLVYGRDTLAELLYLVLVLCAGNYMIFSSMIWVCPRNKTSSRIGAKKISNVHITILEVGQLLTLY